jgi:Sigma-70, region 4
VADIGDVRGAGAVGPTTSVQPDVCLTSDDLFLAPVADPSVPPDALTKKVDEVGRRQLDSLQRREADQKLLDELVAAGFKGPLYRRFEDELIRYGLGALKGWMYTGYIFRLIDNKIMKNGKKMMLNATDSEREQIRRDGDLRTQLAGSTLATTLPKFRDRALQRGGWTLDGGASLTTYFMGATLYSFPNEFHRFRRERTTQLRQDHAAITYEDGTHSADPARAVVQDQVVQDALLRLPPRTAAIVQLHLLGHSHQEIAESLSDPSERAIEGVLHRWRTSERKRDDNKRLLHQSKEGDRDAQR